MGCLGEEDRRFSRTYIVLAFAPSQVKGCLFREFGIWNSEGLGMEDSGRNASIVVQSLLALCMWCDAFFGLMVLWLTVVMAGEAAGSLLGIRDCGALSAQRSSVVDQTSFELDSELSYSFQSSAEILCLAESFHDLEGHCKSGIDNCCNPKIRRLFVVGWLVDVISLVSGACMGICCYTYLPNSGVRESV